MENGITKLKRALMEGSLGIEPDGLSEDFSKVKALTTMKRFLLW